MPKNKKRSHKPKGRAARELAREEAHEELLALEAIFGEDILVRAEDLGFSLRIVPHPGERWNSAAAAGIPGGAEP